MKITSVKSAIKLVNFSRTRFLYSLSSLWEITTPQITVAISPKYGTFLKLIYIAINYIDGILWYSIYISFNKVSYQPIIATHRINYRSLSLECNESSRSHYSSSSLSDSPLKYDSIAFISLMRISSTESVME